MAMAVTAAPLSVPASTRPRRTRQGTTIPADSTPGSYACGTRHEGSIGCTRRTHAATMMLCRSCRSNVDAVTGHSVPPIVVRDVAREVPFIPVAVVFDYRWPARPKCAGGRPALDVLIRAERTLQPRSGLGRTHDAGGRSEGDRRVLVRALVRDGRVAAGEGCSDDRDRDHRRRDGQLGRGRGDPAAIPAFVPAGATAGIGRWLDPSAANRSWPRVGWPMSGDPPTAFAIGEATVDTAVDDVCGRDFGGRALPGQVLDARAPGSRVRVPPHTVLTTTTRPGISAGSATLWALPPTSVRSEEGR